jgi:uncharacterized transporter YbjL
MTGALTSTPGLSAAKEVAGEAADEVVAGYGIAYLFGVLGVVLFVQLMPRILRVNIDEERARFVAANTIEIKPLTRAVKKVDPYGLLPFFMAVALGCVIGAIKIPGINFSLGNSGGCLVAGLIIGHFGHLGGIDLRIDKPTLNFFRELGLVETTGYGVARRISVTAAPERVDLEQSIRYLEGLHARDEFVAFRDWALASEADEMLARINRPITPGFGQVVDE